MVRVLDRNESYHNECKHAVSSSYILHMRITCKLLYVGYMNETMKMRLGEKTGQGVSILIPTSVAMTVLALLQRAVRRRN